MSERYIERRKRGFFGWLFLLVFLGWNALMVAWLLRLADHTSAAMNVSQSDVEQAGTAIGAGMSVVMVLIVWCIGAVITGLLAIVTRGGKTVVVRKA